MDVDAQLLAGLSLRCFQCIATPSAYTAGDDLSGAAVVATLEGLMPEDLMTLALSGRASAVRA